MQPSGLKDQDLEERLKAEISVR
jgi:hypothetical protein